MNLTGPWDRSRVDEFLADATIPIRIGCRTPADDPWMVSLWFQWDGAVHCATGADADVVDFLAADHRVSFEVSTNDPPYMGVRGRGRATTTADEDKRLLRSLLERYLGGTDNELSERLLRPDREEVHVRIEPERLHSWDFTGRMPAKPDPADPDPAE
ncbi:hypothetical protein SAMN04488066_11340 [Halorubrum aquaticum]|uniref:Pyridoxamine 5'-phosphate oxidase n=1 Tax=Halorubrum aquaticum TaxID=387340 RepID=A0A1I3BKJ1_9EURY|nr:pyridoxamine 5'-phosphate oxidase family protein [Halorubrum aquaticum]SFH62773.1 hypothetical protein SAMN04488066_11340 [Halorubrum aquaticum]